MNGILNWYDQFNLVRTPHEPCDIWAHWTAQCVPEMGDWCARNMYIQGHAQYEHRAGLV